LSEWEIMYHLKPAASQAASLLYHEFEFHLVLDNLEESLPVLWSTSQYPFLWKFMVLFM
jgi:hypothetical protein